MDELRKRREEGGRPDREQDRTGKERRDKETDRMREEVFQYSTGQYSRVLYSRAEMSGSIDLTATIVQVKPHTRTALYFIKLLIRGYLNVYTVYRIWLRYTAIIVSQEEEKVATTAPFFSSFIFTDVKFDKNFYSQIATHRFQESDPSTLQRFQELILVPWDVISTRCWLFPSLIFNYIIEVLFVKISDGFERVETAPFEVLALHIPLIEPYPRLDLPIPEVPPRGPLEGFNSSVHV